jgi:hypothetical protein
VVATFIIDWPVLTFLGFAFGAAAPVQRWWRSRAFIAGVITAVVFTSTALISYLVAPDWMWMYYTDPDTVSWAVPFIGIAYIVLFGFAFLSAVGLNASGIRIAWKLAIVSLVFEVGVVAFTWDRYHRVGTTVEWLRGHAAELFSTSPEGPVKTIGVLGPIFAITMAVAFFLVYKGRRATTAGR